MLDDELRVDLRLDLVARRQRQNTGGECLGVGLEPAGPGLRLGPVHGLLEVVRAAARLLHRERVAGLDRVARRLGDLGVHDDVAVRDELAGLRAGLRESGAIDRVVETALEIDEQRLTRRALLLRRALEGVRHLLLEHAVNAAGLLLLTKLEREVGDLAAALLVHAGRRAALLEGALGDALLALEEELHALAAAQAADGTGVTSHLHAPPLRRTAAVVRDRCDVGDRGDGQAGGLERADRGLAAGTRSAHEDLEGLHARVERLARRVLGRDLRGVGRALARALPTGRAGGRPRDHVARRVGDGDDGVIEGGLDVRGAARDDAALALLALRCGLALGVLVLRVLCRLGCVLCHVPFLLLGLRDRLLLAGHGLARTLARARVGARALTAHGETPSVPQAAVAADLLEPLDVQCHFATQIALDGEAAIDDLADLRHLRLGEVAATYRPVDARLLEHLARGRRTDTEDVAERNVNALLARDVDAGDTCHDLALPLLVLRLGADHTDRALTADDPTLIAALPDGRLNFHFGIAPVPLCSLVTFLTSIL